MRTKWINIVVVSTKNKISQTIKNIPIKIILFRNKVLVARVNNQAVINKVSSVKDHLKENNSNQQRNNQTTIKSTLVWLKVINTKYKSTTLKVQSVTDSIDNS